MMLKGLAILAFAKFKVAFRVRMELRILCQFWAQHEVLHWSCRAGLGGVCGLSAFLVAYNAFNVS